MRTIKKGLAHNDIKNVGSVNVRGGVENVNWIPFTLTETHIRFC
jgi:hypothetical protein